MKVEGKYFGVPFTGEVIYQRLGGEEMEIRVTRILLDTGETICLEEDPKDPQWLKETHYLKKGE